MSEMCESVWNFVTINCMIVICCASVFGRLGDYTAVTVL